MAVFSPMHRIQMQARLSCENLKSKPTTLPHAEDVRTDATIELNAFLRPALRHHSSPATRLRLSLPLKELSSISGPDTDLRSSREIFGSRSHISGSQSP